MVFVTDMN